MKRVLCVKCNRFSLAFQVSLFVCVSALFFIANPVYAAVEISDGSVQALYHFNNQDLNDSSIYGRNGAQGTTPFLFTTSSVKLGAAAGDTQKTGFFTVTSTIMDLSGDFTMGFWVQPKASLSSGVYFFLRNTSSINNNTGITYAIACAAGRLEFVHNGVCEINSVQALNVGTWYWILMERRGGRLDAYLDNVLIDSVIDNLTAQSSTDVRFNGAAGGSGIGDMYYDEIFFMNQAISTSTRNALWNEGVGAEICVVKRCGLGTFISRDTTASVDIDLVFRVLLLIAVLYLAVEVRRMRKYSEKGGN